MTVMIDDAGRPGAPPTRPDLGAAASGLAGRVVRTPVVSSPALDRFAGARLWLKAENLQRGGSYKIRGALRAVARSAADGHRGVLAQSTGNHAVAVALAAAEYGLTAAVVLPPRNSYTPVAGTQSDKIRHARQKGYEGDPCSNCQQLTLVRSGACMKCDTCGETTGCG